MARRNQICFMTDELVSEKLIEKQAQIAKEVGRMPARSEIIRAAVYRYLELPEPGFAIEDSPRAISRNKRE